MISYKRNGAMRFITIGRLSISFVIRKSPRNLTAYQIKKRRVPKASV